MVKRRPWHLILVAIVLAGIAAVAWWQPWSARAAAKPAWTTVTADRGTISAQVTASGTLKPRVLVEVSSQVSGRVAEVRVDYEDRVSKGQVLARLDTSTLEAQLAQVNANLAVARANLQEAKTTAEGAEKTWMRQKALADQQLISVAELETAETALASARARVTAQQAQVTQARASLEQSQANLGYATIYAPLDGVVINRAIDVGQTVAASLSAPTLFTIAGDLGHMQIDTSVAESDIGRIESGMKVTFTVDAFPGKQLSGVVRQVRNQATTVSNVVTYDAVIDVENADGKLRPGMTANCTFVISEIKDAVRVPNAALRFQPNMDQLQTLMGGKGPPAGMKPPAGMGPPGGGGMGAPGGGAAGGRAMPADRKVLWRVKDGVAQPVPVKIGLSDGSRTEIVEGDLATGDELVSEMRGGGKKAVKLPGAF
ncbi:MAG TPA: efflux RND transporter periplasmic adaptor subunit [Kofleriaceae bacterium]|nr:efflux RND transporter periplasmic adaptor subunit [Kofleriaceae bacterium]